MKELFSELAKQLYDGNREGVVGLTQEALEQGASARQILDEGLLPGMEIVGRDFKEGELFVPEIIVAARAMHSAIDLLRPFFISNEVMRLGTIVLGTVKGDLHDIGKKLVAIMMQGAGFKVIDLGTDVAPERFVEVVREERAELLGLSALLSTTMPMMKTTLDIIKAANLDYPVSVLVGGAPVTQAWCDEIGAQGYAPEAVTAVERARQLLNK